MALIFQKGMLCIFLIFVLSVGNTQACFHCSTNALTTMRYLLYRLKSDHQDDEVAMEKIITVAKQLIEDLKEELNQDMLDHYALSQVAVEFEKCVESIVDTKVKGDQLRILLKLRFWKLQAKIRDIVQDFKKRVCPNKQGGSNCGVAIQEFTECVACERTRVFCIGGPPNLQQWFDKCNCFCVDNYCTDMATGEQCSPCKDHKSQLNRALHCGEQDIHFVEKQDLRMNCDMEWHHKLEQPLKYKFEKLSSARAPVYTEDPLFVKKAVDSSDSGWYRCTAMNYTGFLLSTKSFFTKVVPKASVEAITFPTLPPSVEVTESTLDVEKMIKTYAPVIAIVCGISIGLLIIGMGVYVYSRRKSGKLRALMKTRDIESMMEGIID
ncbi:izumo sperm-egg fusion protein 1 [Pyxicephalus adspersus]|uniref:izumo sperm-egg fusion protein 1 n=1 Tax=Pyxicephalus adspersus TaxID=30357 RepID=UPI003B5BA6C1